MPKHQLLLISGSLRKASYNKMLLRESARIYGAETVVEADLNMPLYNGDDEEKSGLPESALLLHSQITAADAVIIATPEYNQSFSGVLKNALDWLSRANPQPWADKPVATLTAAAGRAGGARAQYALRLAMTPFQPHLITGPEVLVANAAGEFDDQGLINNEHYQKALTGLMDKLRQMTK